MTLITLDEFKDMTMLRENAQNKIGNLALQNLIEVASTQIENYCGRRLASSTIIQEIDGTGNHILLLREYPMTALTSVAWTDFGGATGTDDTSLIRFNSSGVLRFRSPASTFHDNRTYTVTYTAGYTEIPGPIKHAAGLWVTELLHGSFSQGTPGKPSDLMELSSEQIGELLEDYRRKGAR